MKPAAAGHLDPVQEDFAAEAMTTVTPPVPAPSPAPKLPVAPEAPLPPSPHGTCVNCGRDVTLRQVATDSTRHTYQWVPDDEPARPGKRCSEAAMPAYHWADGATAAVYRVST